MVKRGYNGDRGERERRGQERQEKEGGVSHEVAVGLIGVEE